MNFMYKAGRYSAQDSMSDLISDNYLMLQVVSRYGIALGVGDDTIAEVCEKYNIDVNTFMAIVNLLIYNDKSSVKSSHNAISPISLVEYLSKSHDYFLDFKFPHIRRKLKDAIAGGEQMVVAIILRHFDEYVAEVTRHMKHEEQIVFPYIIKLLEGEELSNKFNIEAFADHHENINSKLTELKNILIKYYPIQSSNELCNVLFDIFVCESDLAFHADVEDYLLVPVIKSLKSNCDE